MKFNKEVSKILDWKPAQPDHAIERVRIIVRIASELPVKFLRKLAADGEDRRIKLGFTSKNLRKGHQILISPQGSNVEPQSTQLHGWDWQKLSPANLPIETLVVENQALVYETAEYSRWVNFIQRFEEAALPCINAISDVMDIDAVSLEYVDRFVFSGEHTDAAPGKFLENIAEYLHEEAANGAELWHLHRGWFEHINNQKVLVNQNIDAQDGNMADGKVSRSVQVFTKTELRINQETFDYDVVKGHLESMHSRSKQILSSILSKEMCNMIGLEKEEN